MWGNKIGWMIALAIGGILVFGMTKLSSAVQPSEMTPKVAKDTKYFDKIELVPGPETVLTMDETGDPSSDYQEAIDAYTANPTIYEKFDSSKIDQMEASEKLLPSTRIKDMHMFEKNPGKIINFANIKEPMEALRYVGLSTATKAQYLLRIKKDVAGAKKYAEAAFSLGSKMFYERVTYEEFEASLGIMGASADTLASIADEQKDDALKSRIKAFVDARKALLGGRQMDQRRVTKNKDGNESAARAGDLFAMAEKSKERMWRVEACLQLARTARNVGDNGRGVDQRHARFLMDHLAKNDPDPIVRTAATKARDITDDEYFKQN